jgi:hypothetical protein
VRGVCSREHCHACSTHTDPPTNKHASSGIQVIMSYTQMICGSCTESSRKALKRCCHETSLQLVCYLVASMLQLCCLTKVNGSIRHNAQHAGRVAPAARQNTAYTTDSTLVVIVYNTEQLQLQVAPRGITLGCAVHCWVHCCVCLLACYSGLCWCGSTSAGAATSWQLPC